MSAGRSLRPRETRYYVLRIAGRDTEIARVSPRGAPSVYDPASRTWVVDQSLGAEIRMSDDWVPAQPGDLPADIEIEPETTDADYVPRRRRRRRSLLPWAR